MRRVDKKLNIIKANVLAEQRYLESKGLLSENELSNAERSFERKKRLGDPYGDLDFSGPQKNDYDIIELAKGIVSSSFGDRRKENELIKVTSEKYNFNAETKYNLIVAVEKARKQLTDLKENNLTGIANYGEDAKTIAFRNLMDAFKAVKNGVLPKEAGIGIAFKEFEKYASEEEMNKVNNEYRDIATKYVNEENLVDLDENRFSHWERQYEELLKNDRISSFINQFEKYRKNALANVDLEIRPVFSDIQVRFVDKNVPSTAGKDKFRDIHVDTDSSNYESGQIMFKYNDTTCIFKGNQQGDSIDYTYDKTINTDYNKPRTKEGLQVAKTFEDMCKSFRFRLNKNEVPTSFYKK